MYSRIEKRTGKVRYCEEYRDPLTMKYRTVSVTFDRDTVKNRREALAILSEKIENVTAPAASNLSLRQLVAEYKTDSKRAVRASTYKRNCIALDSILKIIGGDVLIEKLTARYIKNKFIESGKAASTLNGYITRLKAMIRWGYASDLISSTASIDKLDRFPEPNIKISDKYLESDELRLLIDSMKKPVWAAFTEFLALSGLRVGEAIALEKKDVDLENMVIHVSKTFDPSNRVVGPAKNENSVDDVVIQPQLAETIKYINAIMRRQQIEHGYRSKLFISSNTGDYIKYHTFNAYFRKHARAVVGRSLSTHSLRHTHASLLFESGFSLDEVSRRLRHGNSKITKDVYIHITQKLREKDAEKIKAVNLI